MVIDVFISYASADKSFVEELKQFLEDSGDIKCWLDKHEIDYGHAFNAKIAEGLARADYFLLILSATSVKSRWVEEEWTTAHWEQVNTGATKLIPVLLDDCEVPKIFANKLFCDLRTNRLEEMRKLKTKLIPKESVAAVDPSALEEAYEHWMRAYREYDALRQVVFHRPSFRDGMISTLHLFPHHREELHFGPFHRSVSSAMLHDWFGVGGDLWAAYIAATIGGHGATSSSEEPEPASTQCR